MSEVSTSHNWSINESEVPTLVDRFSDFEIMYDVITIPIIVQLTQELDSLCGQRPIYALGLFSFFLWRIFYPVDNQMFIN